MNDLPPEPAGAAIAKTIHAPLASFMFAAVYVAVVLAIDTLAAWHVHFLVEWQAFRWHIGRFDLFKFIAWFLLPLLFCARDLDRSWFTFHGWRRVDFIVLGVALVGGIAAMMVVAVTPGLRAIYPSWGQFPLSDRLLLAGSTLLWTLSWLAGWEFMHRYWMARRALAVLPRWGWLIIPVSETIYHLQKPWPETLAMLAFSLALTPWAIARRNALLPFTAHLIIELELIVFLAIV